VAPGSYQITVNEVEVLTSSAESAESPESGSAE
jgi:hypothetical protein